MWLPLPHLLNMVPVQVDAWYRTGASGVAISILSMALGAGSLSWLILRTTGSIVAACTGGLLLLVNPNILYLQSTPMSEPLLFGLALFSIAATATWTDDPVVANGPEPSNGPGSAHRRQTIVPGLALAGACLTRYEAWPITGAVLVLGLAVLLRRGQPWQRSLNDVARLAVWPIAAVVIFSANSRWVVGDWFVSSGFFVPENVEALGHPLVAWRQVRVGLTMLAGPVLPGAGYVAAVLVVWTFVRSARRAPLVLLLALYAAAALPVSAYVQGHPFRIRYDAPLVIAAASLTAGGIAVLWRPLRIVAAVVVLAMILRGTSPIDLQAPLVVESQREAVNQAGRRAVTAYLQQHYDGREIMMSMGSLGHYMHDLSLAGFDLDQFLHEGNGEIWRFAMLQPRGHVGWLIIERSAEGGDALHQASRRARWLDGFTKVAEGGGAELYRGTP